MTILLPVPDWMLLSDVCDIRKLTEAYIGRNELEGIKFTETLHSKRAGDCQELWRARRTSRDLFGVESFCIDYFAEEQPICPSVRMFALVSR